MRVSFLLLGLLLVSPPGFGRAAMRMMRGVRTEKDLYLAHFIEFGPHVGSDSFRYLPRSLLKTCGQKLRQGSSGNHLKEFADSQANPWKIADYIDQHLIDLGTDLGKEILEFLEGVETLSQNTSLLIVQKVRRLKAAPGRGKQLPTQYLGHKTFVHLSFVGMLAVSKPDLSGEPLPMVVNLAPRGFVLPPFHITDFPKHLDVPPPLWIPQWNKMTGGKRKIGLPVVLNSHMALDQTRDLIVALAYFHGLLPSGLIVPPGTVFRPDDSQEVHGPTEIAPSIYYLEAVGKLHNFFYRREGFHEEAFLPYQGKLSEGREPLDTHVRAMAYEEMENYVAELITRGTNVAKALLGRPLLDLTFDGEGWLIPISDPLENRSLADCARQLLAKTRARRRRPGF
jgi:hypothetical protein